MSSRWLALIIFAVLCLFIVKDKKLTINQKINRYGMMFAEGMVGGLIIDSIGVNAGYYYFPRQPLYSWEYWAIVIPCWGVFGLLLNFLWETVGNEKFIRGTLATLPILFLWYEGTNLLTQSWVYTVPFYTVALGWIPLVYVFSGCNRRRKVVFKFDAWIKECSGLPKFGLQVLRAMLVCVMFPLLLVSIAKIIRDLFSLKKARVSLKSYLIEYLMLRGNN